jgi:subtilisin family serine protease
LFAPGQDITSAWIGSDVATNTISGTSMASPHVAGAAALMLAFNPAATPAQVNSAIVSSATAGRLTSTGFLSPNRLLYTGFIPVP